MSSLTDLEGKIALVTGGGTGVGLAIAKGFAANGATVYIAGRRDEKLQEVHKEYANILPLRMDITKKEDIDGAAKLIAQNHGKLHILVNNVGTTGPFYPLDKNVDYSSLGYASSASTLDTNISDVWSNSTLFRMYDPADWAKVYEVNIIAPFFTTMGFLDLLKAGAGTDTSSVINISSAAGTPNAKVMYCIPAYPASKAGLEKLTINLATEFALNEIPIRVNCIAMGVYPSELTGDEESVNRRVSTAPLPGLINHTPLKRAAREKEVASTAVYLGSPMSGYTNGTTINTDGGLRLVNP
ncbi:hypothetical protein PQX77_006974 [Marasmius sp. AFHP31]|nr:hypothetical protein PQX77_006974 [Marasmius sp. AFHP31]